MPNDDNITDKYSLKFYKLIKTPAMVNLGIKTFASHAQSSFTTVLDL